MNTVELSELRAWLGASGVKLREGAEADAKLNELRDLYMPFADQLSRVLLMPLPPRLPPPKSRYNWETTQWGKTRGTMRISREGPRTPNRSEMLMSSARIGLVMGMFIVAISGICAADGTFVWRNEASDIREPEQKAVLLFDDGLEDLVLEVRYEGAPENFDGSFRFLPGRACVPTTRDSSST